MMLAPLGAAAAVLILLCLHLLRRYICQHGLLTVLAHLAIGHHTHGNHLNNRTWFTAATRSRNGYHMGWLARRPRAHRMGMFWGGLLAIVYLVVGWRTDRTLTLVLLWTVAISVLVLTLLGSARHLARRPHRKTVVHPIAAKLAAHMKMSPPAVARNLRIRPGLDGLSPGDTAAILAGFPDEYHASASDREFVEGIFSSFLPAKLAFRWETDRYPMRMRAICKASPPREVTVTVWAETMDGLGYGQYFLGCSAGAATEVWDTNTEDPHAMCGGRTRRGKTNVNLGVIAQGLRRGEAFSAVDPKRVSLSCLVGVPGFRLASDPRDVAAMWALIKDVRQEMDRAIDGDPVLDTQGRPRPHKLVLEEINQLFALFRSHWEDAKETGQRITDVPAWRDVKAILHQGAQFGYTVMVDGQDLTAQVLFGSRSQFGTILMTGFTPKQWGYVVGTTPIPPSPTRKGRFHLVRGTEHTIVQVVCADTRGGAANEQSWREFALGGRDAEAEAPTNGWRYWAARLPRLALPHSQYRPGAAEPEGPKAIPAVLIGNTEAAAYLEMKRNAFITARRRQPINGEFETDIRGSAQPAWTRESLDAWRAARPLAKSGRG